METCETFTLPHGKHGCLRGGGRGGGGGRLEAKPIIQGAFDGEETGSFLFSFYFLLRCYACLVVQEEGVDGDHAPPSTRPKFDVQFSHVCTYLDLVLFDLVLCKHVIIPCSTDLIVPRDKSHRKGKRHAKPASCGCGNSSDLVYSNK